jgi:hypothetical protein
MSKYIITVSFGRYSRPEEHTVKSESPRHAAVEIKKRDWFRNSGAQIKGIRKA